MKKDVTVYLMTKSPDRRATQLRKDADLPDDPLERLNRYRFVEATESDSAEKPEFAIGFVDPITEHPFVKSGIYSDLHYMKVRVDQLKIPSGAIRTLEKKFIRQHILKNPDIKSQNDISTSTLGDLFDMARDEVFRKTSPTTKYYDVSISPVVGVNGEAHLVVVYATGSVADEIALLLTKAHWDSELALFRLGMDADDLWQLDDKLRAVPGYTDPVDYPNFLEWLWYWAERGPSGKDVEFIVSLDRSITLLSATDPIRKVKITVDDPGETREARDLRKDGAHVVEINLALTANAHDNPETYTLSPRKTALKGLEFAFLEDEKEDDATDRVLVQMLHQSNWVWKVVCLLMKLATTYKRAVDVSLTKLSADTKRYYDYRGWIEGRDDED